MPVGDQLCVSLTERLHAYETLRSKFGFPKHIDKIDAENLHAAAGEVYQDDLESSLGNELVQFVC